MQKFNGRRSVFNFWMINSAFLQYSLLRILFNFIYWDHSDYGTTWRLSGEHAKPITGPGKVPLSYCPCIQAYKKIRHCLSLLNIPEPTAAVAAVKEPYYLCLNYVRVQVGHSTVQSTPYFLLHWIHWAIDATL